MKHCFKKFMALLLATLMVMSAFGGLSVFAANVCTHEEWIEWEVNGESTVAPTCTTPGYTWIKCANPECEKVDAKDFVPALGHDLVWTCTAEDYEDVACGEFYKIYKGCTRCDYIEMWGDDPTVSDGYKVHNYSEFYIVTKPTCEVNGELKLVCTEHTDCPEIAVKIERLDPNGEHTWSKVSGRDPDCVNPGWADFECDKCPATKHEDYDALGHFWNGGVYLDADTCDKTYTCLACSTTKVVVEHRGTGLDVVNHHAGTPADQNCYDYKWCNHCGTFFEKVTKHNYGTPESIIDTVKHECREKYTCLDCGFVEEKVVAHTMLQVTVTIQPTCTLFGAAVKVCLACGYREDLVVLDPTGHDFDYKTTDPDKKWSDAEIAALVVVTNPTCTTEGGVVVTCRNGCGETFTEAPKPALGHDMQITNIDPVTCIAPEYVTETCANGCGLVKQYYRGEKDENAHRPEDYTITTFPTCTTDGEATLYCKLCDFVDEHITYEKAIADHPNFKNPERLLKFNHTFTAAHANILASLNAGKPAAEQLKVGDSALYNTTTVPGTCVAQGHLIASCYICQAQIDTPTPIDPSNHVSPGNYAGGYLHTDGLTYLRLPNCTDNALLWRYCSTCDTAYSQMVDNSALGHATTTADGATVTTTPAVPPQCGVPGSTEKTEAICNHVFKVIVRVDDKDGNGKADIDGDGVEDEIATFMSGIYTVDVDGFVVVKATGYYVYADPVEITCHHVTVTGGDTIPALKHDWEEDGYTADVPGKNPTCTLPGNNPLWHCDKCGADHPVNNGAILNALGHDWKDVPAKTPTCSVPGYTAHKRCDRCGAEDGKIIQYCPGIGSRTEDSYCDDHLKTPTCTEDGVGYGEICHTCGECNGNHVVIPALGHNYITLSLNSAPTCTDPSFTFTFCTLCAHTKASIEGVNPNETEPCVAPTINVNIAGVATVGGAPVLATWPEAGINAPVVKLGYNQLIKLPALDLEDYCAVKITYSMDGSDVTAGNFATAPSHVIGLKNQAVDYGNASENPTGADMTGDLGHTDMVFAGGAGWTNYRVAYVDLTYVDYNGEMWISVYNPVGTEIAITAIEFVPDPYGCREIYDYVWETGHTISSWTTGNACEGTTTIVGCVNCTYVESESSVGGIGHDIASHPANSKTAVCSRCQGVFDAHENKYVITGVITKSEIDPDDANVCVTTTYALISCTECEFRTAEIQSIVPGTHVWTNIDHADNVTPNYEHGGVQMQGCANGCGATNRVELDALTGLFLSMDIVNDDNADAGFTDSSLVRVDINLTSSSIPMWGFQFDLAYDDDVLEFVSAEFTSDVFVTGRKANNNVTATGSYVTVAGNVANTVDGKSQNVAVTGDEEIVSLYFRVNCANAVVSALTFENILAIENDYDVLGCAGTNSAIEIERYLDINADGDVNIADILNTYQIISGEVADDYKVTVDVDKDGVITIADFLALYDYIAGEKSYEEMREMGIN